MNQAFIRLLKCLLLLDLFPLSFSFFFSLTMKFLLNLTVNQLSLEVFVLDALNILHFKFMQLVINYLSVGHLTLILRYQFLLNFLIKRLHLSFIKLFPLLINFLLVVEFALLKLFLDLSFLKYITK